MHTRTQFIKTSLHGLLYVGGKTEVHLRNNYFNILARSWQYRLARSFEVKAALFILIRLLSVSTPHFPNHYNIRLIKLWVNPYGLEAQCSYNNSPLHRLWIIL